jgi:SAM-dependent methyltransferase
VPSTYAGGELDALAAAQRYQEWIAEQFRPYLRGSVIELGAGIGTMAQKWIDCAERLHLVEPAENLYPLLKARFAGDPRVVLHHGVLEEVVSRSDGPRPGTMDAVILVNVLEHIERDADALGLLRRLLVPGGHLMVFVPAMPSLYGSLDQKFGHYRRYTKAGLARLCEQAGYQTVRLAHFDVLGVVPWWLTNCVMRRSHLSLAMARAYDRFFVPTGRWLERHMTFPFGKNLVYIGRKPTT